MPNGGVDILDDPVVWLFGNGASATLSVRQLLDAAPGALPDKEDEEMYSALAEHLSWRYLGTASMESMKEYLKEPGLVGDRLWEKVAFRLPAHSVAGCW